MSTQAEPQSLLLKTGGVNPHKNYYKEQETINKFIPIAQKLYSKFSPNQADNELHPTNLSLLTCNLRNYMEKWAGRPMREEIISNANNANFRMKSLPFTKLPRKLFEDYSVSGSLFEMLNYLFDFKYKQINNNNNLNFNYSFLHNLSDLTKHKLLSQGSQISPQSQSLQMSQVEFEQYRAFNTIFNGMIQYLRNTGKLRAHVIYFSKGINDASRVNELSKIVISHGGMVSQAWNTSVTHIIVPNNDEILDKDSNIVRTLKVDSKKKEAYIHFWYFPESYDAWVPQNMVDQPANNTWEPPPGPWRVGERFITDLEIFNEWGVEFDYEIDDQIFEENVNNNSNNNNISNPSQKLPSNATTSITGTKRKTRDFGPTGDSPHANSSNSSNSTNSSIASAPNNNNIQNINGMPPKKKQRTGLKPIVTNGSISHNNMNNLSNSNNSINSNNNSNNNHSKGSKSKQSSKNAKPMRLRLSLKRHNAPSTQAAAHGRTPGQIAMELKGKKENINPQLKYGDLMPYNGPKLTRIAPKKPQHPVVMPSYSRWFRLDRIHAIEYLAMSEMFCDRSMQYHKRYMEVRNFIVNTWRMNPRIYLTVTSLRKVLVCDAGKVFKIHKFLMEWGLINYRVDEGSIPRWEPPILDYTHVETPFGIKLALKPKDANNGSNSQNSGNTGQKDEKNGKKESKEKKGKMEGKMEGKGVKKGKKGKEEIEDGMDGIEADKEMYLMRENLFAAASEKLKCQDDITNVVVAGEQENNNNNNNEVLVKNAKESKYLCVLCGLDCSVARYTCLVEKSMIICAKCFETKRYPSIFDKKDFEVDLESKPKESSNPNEMDFLDQTGLLSNSNESESGRIEPWPLALRNKLLEALTKFHDNWNKVAQYVGKPKSECIAQFVQLPIEDPYLEADERSGEHGKEKSYHPSHPSMTQSNVSDAFGDDIKLSPFADVSHPYLGQAASLAALVSPDIVKVASNAALQYLYKINKNEGARGKKKGRGRSKSPRSPKSPKSAKSPKSGKKRNGMNGMDMGEDGNERNEMGMNVDGRNWQKFPQNSGEIKAMAAGVLGASSVIAKALKNHTDSHVQQLLQHLVLLQSQKVKTKMEHLDALWNVLQEERSEIEDLKHELFRERIELARQRMQVGILSSSTVNPHTQDME